MALEELNYDYHDHVQQESDKQLAVRFYQDAVQDDEKSIAEGRPMFTDTVMIEIRVRGDRNNIVQRPARLDDQKRFREAYRAFKDNEQAVVVGTPLKDWPPLSKAMVMELNHLGFQTVEQLADASDSICAKVGGLTQFKQKAKAFIAFSKDTAVIGVMQQKLNDQENENEVLKRNLAGALARLEALETAAEQTKKSKG